MNCTQDNVLQVQVFNVAIQTVSGEKRPINNHWQQSDELRDCNFAIYQQYCKIGNQNVVVPDCQQQTEVRPMVVRFM